MNTTTEIAVTRETYGIAARLIQDEPACKIFLVDAKDPDREPRALSWKTSRVETEEGEVGEPHNGKLVYVDYEGDDCFLSFKNLKPMSGHCHFIFDVPAEKYLAAQQTPVTSTYPFKLSGELKDELDKRIEALFEFCLENRLPAHVTVSHAIDVDEEGEECGESVSNLTLRFDHEGRFSQQVAAASSRPPSPRGGMAGIGAMVAQVLAGSDR